MCKKNIQNISLENFRQISWTIVRIVVIIVITTTTTTTILLLQYYYYYYNNILHRSGIMTYACW